MLQRERRRGDGDGRGGLAEALDEEESRGSESHKTGEKKVKGGKKSGERSKRGEREERRSCFRFFYGVVALVFSFSPRFASKREADAGFVATAALSLWWQEEARGRG